MQQKNYGNLNLEEQIVPADPEYRAMNRKITELIEKRGWDVIWNCTAVMWTKYL